MSRDRISFDEHGGGDVRDDYNGQAEREGKREGDSTGGMQCDPLMHRYITHGKAVSYFVPYVEEGHWYISVKQTCHSSSLVRQVH